MRICSTNVYVDSSGYRNNLEITIKDGQYSATSDFLEGKELSLLVDACLTTMTADAVEELLIDWMYNINYEKLFSVIYPKIKNEDWFNEIIVAEEIKTMIND